MAQPTRSGRTPKRTYTEMEPLLPESDDDYMPEPAASKSPKPPKTKASKSSASATTTTTKQKPKEAQLEKIPKYYFTENRARFFTGNWYKEVTQRDEFWEDFNRNVPAGVLRRRAVVAIDTTYAARTAAAIEARSKRTTPSSTGNRSAAPASGTVTVDIPGSLTPITCHVCQKKSDNGTDICNLCLAQDDDGFNDLVVVKSEGKAETKLRAKPFGTKAEPLKLEDEVKPEEDLENPNELQAAPTPTNGDESVVFTLADGRKAIMIEGKWEIVTGTEKPKLDR